MTIPKIGFPRDLSTLFLVIKEKTVSTAQYLADLVKHYSLAIYSSLGNLVGRILPGRVTVLSPPPQFVVIPKTPTKPTFLDASTLTESISNETKAEIKEEVLNNKIEIKEEVVFKTEIKKEQQFPSFNDVANKLNQASGVKFSDVSMLKMIDLARSVLNAQADEKTFNQQIADPFYTSPTSDV